jgi:hypothetical protein
MRMVDAQRRFLEGSSAQMVLREGERNTDVLCERALNDLFPPERWARLRRCL